MRSSRPSSCVIFLLASFLFQFFSLAVEQLDHYEPIEDPSTNDIRVSDGDVAYLLSQQLQLRSRASTTREFHSILRPASHLDKDGRTWQESSSPQNTMSFQALVIKPSPMAFTSIERESRQATASNAPVRGPGALQTEQQAKEASIVLRLYVSQRPGARIAMVQRAEPWSGNQKLGLGETMPAYRITELLKTILVQSGASHREKRFDELNMMERGIVQKGRRRNQSKKKKDKPEPKFYIDDTPKVILVRLSPGEKQMFREAKFPLPMRSSTTVLARSQGSNYPRVRDMLASFRSVQVVVDTLSQNRGSFNNAYVANYKVRKVDAFKGFDKKRESQRAKENKDKEKRRQRNEKELRKAAKKSGRVPADESQWEQWEKLQKKSQRQRQNRNSDGAPMARLQKRDQPPTFSSQLWTWVRGSPQRTTATTMAGPIGEANERALSSAPPTEVDEPIYSPLLASDMDEPLEDSMYVALVLKHQRTSFRQKSAQIPETARISPPDSDLDSRTPSPSTPSDLRMPEAKIVVDDKRENARGQSSTFSKAPKFRLSWKGSLGLGGTTDATNPNTQQIPFTMAHRQQSQFQSANVPAFLLSTEPLPQSHINDDDNDRAAGRYPIEEEKQRSKSIEEQLKDIRQERIPWGLHDFDVFPEDVAGAKRSESH